MMTYHIENINQLSNADLEMIYTDSQLNRELLEQVKAFLQHSGIVNFSYCKINPQGEYSIAMTYSFEEMSAYYQSKLWLIDHSLDFEDDVYFRLIDYNDYPNIESSSYYPYVKDQVVIMIQHVIFGVKHAFHFSLSCVAYQSFVKAEQTYLMYSVLESVLKWLYASVRMRCAISLNFDGYDFNTIPSIKQGDKAPVEYNGVMLSRREMDYLKVVSMGCTAKEIALHIAKSPRSVEKAIFDLKNKLGANTKDQLVCMAKTILVCNLLSKHD